MGFRDSVLGSVSPWGLRGIRAVEAAPDLQVALGGLGGLYAGRAMYVHVIDRG